MNLLQQFPAHNFTLLGAILGLPLLGALANGIFGKRLGKQGVTLAALVASGGSFLISLLAFAALLSTGGDSAEPSRLVWTVWRWFSVNGAVGQRVPIDVAFSIDALSGIMALVVTGVGFVIHVYSTAYMDKDPSYARFFAYLNLFIFSMLLLVLGDNMAVMFVGWEGVGLCSYLLIGFWFTDEAKASAGKKAFITGRIGDFGLLLAMAMVVKWAGTLRWHELEAKAPRLVREIALWPIGKLEQSALPAGVVDAITPSEPIAVGAVTLVGLALFLGCVGKSAQIPLYVWLPDAVAGPTPVSALIYSATTVTAGVYLVARCSTIFALSPVAMGVVSAVGAATALLAASIAIFQTDLKKVLAYSTVSQLGFMFIGVGVGAFAAGLFHVVTHALFTGCLFLCSGSVIFMMRKRIGDDDRSRDMRNMGGLRKYMPITHGTFLVSCLAIAGCPLLSGFWSRDEILWKAFSTKLVPAEASFLWSLPSWWGPMVFVVGLAAAVGTAFYIFRAYFLTFSGSFRGWRPRPGWRKRGHRRAADADEPVKGPVPTESPRVMTYPLVALAAGATVIGFVYADPLHHLTRWSPFVAFEHFLQPVFATALGSVTGRGVDSLLWPLVAIGVAAFLSGAGTAYVVYYQRRGEPARQLAARFPRLLRWGRAKWKVDELYDATIISFTHVMGETAADFDHKVIDGALTKLTALLYRLLGTALRALHTGRVQVYAAAMVVGLAGVGWYLVEPHADVTVDDSQLLSRGTMSYAAARGHGYAYRWYAEGEPVPERFSEQSSYELKLRRSCTPTTVHLGVRNALGRVARHSFVACRPAPHDRRCCSRALQSYAAERPARSQRPRAQAPTSSPPQIRLDRGDPGAAERRGQPGLLRQPGRAPSAAPLPQRGELR